MRETRFLGLDCLELANERVTLLVTRSVGPRIIALHLDGGANLLAELPEQRIESEGQRPYHFRGGHRLWHAPEVRQRTYQPDDDPLQVRELAEGLLLTQPVEAATGLQKEVAVHLVGDQAQVILEHQLTNHNLWAIQCAPWAITQLVPGGTAVLPQPEQPADSDGLRPNRAIALWPYTDINSPHITWGNRFIRVEATMSEGALKIGFPNPAGWLAYHQKGTLFVKQAAYDPQASYYDHGSSSQCYCCTYFLELETLGPQSTIEPGQTITHRESWHLFQQASLPATESGLEALAHTFSFSASV